MLLENPSYRRIGNPEKKKKKRKKNKSFIQVTAAIERENERSGMFTLRDGCVSKYAVWILFWRLVCFLSTQSLWTYYFVLFSFLFFFLSGGTALSKEERRNEKTKTKRVDGSNELLTMFGNATGVIAYTIYWIYIYIDEICTHVMGRDQTPEDISTETTSQMLCCFIYHICIHIRPMIKRWWRNERWTHHHHVHQHRNQNHPLWWTSQLNTYMCVCNWTV